MPLIVFIFVMITSSAFAETVINYPDGSTYTLETEERVYVAEPQKLFTKRDYSNGNVTFKGAVPNQKRDYVEPPDNGSEGEMGSVQWCETYVPWSEGLTFNMVWWQRICDTNDDGEYNFCEDYIPKQGLTFGGGSSTSDPDDLRYEEECAN